jgi:hypothetical protein
MGRFTGFLILCILSVCRAGNAASAVSDSLTDHPGSSSVGPPDSVSGGDPEQKSGERVGQSDRRSRKRQRGASEKKDDRNSPFPENSPVNSGIPGEFSEGEIRNRDEEQQFLLLRCLLCTVSHFFGGVKQIFKNIKDPRNPEKTVYPLPCLFFTGILMFLSGFGARRQIGHLLRNNDASSSKFNALFNTEKCPHGDTLNAVFMNLSTDEMQESITSLTETLIRKKILYRHRLFNRYFLIAVDGTGVLTFHERHCDHCLTKKKSDGRILYYHNVLEAKLITPDGSAFSLMTEFIENPEENVSKQDCELKAFYRLADRLKKRFPGLPVCLCADGLFACGPVFELCEKNGWKYVITLKDRDLPGVNSESETLSRMETGNRLTFRTGKQAEIKQSFRWINNISYEDSYKNEHAVSVLECIETKPHKEELKTKKFKWITNHKIHTGNIIPLATEGGRLRWKIENEGFNAQKNGGFELEHAYSRNENAGKIFYYLLQIAHILFQLISKGSLFTKAFPKGVGSLKNIMFRMKEAWRNLRISSDEIRAMLSEKIQIRFDTS